MVMDSKMTAWCSLVGAHDAGVAGAGLHLDLAARQRRAAVRAPVIDALDLQGEQGEQTRQAVGVLQGASLVAGQRSGAKSCSARDELAGCVQARTSPVSWSRNSVMRPPRMSTPSGLSSVTLLDSAAAYQTLRR